MKKPVRILIVEDIAEDIHLAKHEICKIMSGCEFQIVQTYQEFLKALDSFEPDVIISDYTLPHFDGLKALALAQKHAPLTPFIMWSGSISENLAVECMRAGASNYIFKDNLKRLGPAILHALEERNLLLARKQAEEELRERERQLRILLANLPGPVYRCHNDADFTMEFISDGIEQLTGYQAQDFRDHRRHFGKMIHPADQARVWTEIQAAIQKQQPFELVYRIHTATGEEKWVWEKGQGVHDENGQLQALEGFITDITVRKQAEEKYQSIFENSIEGIFQSSPQGRYLNLNPAMARLYGYASREEMIASIHDIATQIYVEPDKRSEFKRLIQTNGEVESFEAKNYCKDGRIIWTSTSARAVCDRDGTVLYYEGSIQDITQRKRTEEALQNSEKHFRALIENGLDDISLLAADGSLLWESPSTVRNLGYQPNEFVGRNIFELMHPEDLAWTHNTFKALLKHPEDRQRGTFRLRRSDGTWRWAEAIATNLLNDESVNAIVVNYRDITEQKQAEIELQQKNDDLALINTLNEAINRGQKLDTVVTRLRDEFKRIFSSEYTNMYLLSPDGQSIKLNQYSIPADIATKIERVIGRAMPGIEIPVQEDGVFQRVLRSGLGTVISDPQEIQTWIGEFIETASLPALAKTTIRTFLPQIYKILNIKSTVLVPLISDGKALGVINVSGSTILTEQDLKRIENICGQLTIALHRRQVEEILKEERNLLRTLIDNLPDRIYAMDRKGRKTLSNTADWQASGEKTMNEVIGRTDFDLYPLKMAEGFWKLDKAVLDSGQPAINHEESGLDPNGNTVSILTTKIPLRDETGNVIGLVGIGRDITERKQVDAERQAILEIMQGLANTKDLQELLKLVHHSIAKVIYAENFYVCLYQESTGLFEEIYSVDQYDPPQPPSRLENSITSYAFRSGEPLLLTQASFSELASQGKVKLIGTDSASWLGVPLKTSGRTIGVMAVQDYENDNRYSEREKDFLTSIATQVALVIERKRAEEALRESEEHYRTIFEGVQDAIFVESLDGKILMVNKRACEMFGYTYEEFLTKTVHDLVPPNHSALMAGRTAESLSQEPRETINKRANGEVFPIEISGRIQVIHGQKVLLVVVRDITERKRSEAAEREQRVLAEALRETAETLSRTLDYGQVLDHILTAVERVVPHDAGSILLIEDGAAQVVRFHGYDKYEYDPKIMGVKLPLATTNLRQILDTRQPVVVYDTYAYPGWQKMPETDWLRSSVGAPISIYGEIIGFICLDSQIPEYFTPIHAGRLEAFANQAALAIHNARLLQQAQDEIAERKQAEISLQRERERAQNYLDIAGVTMLALNRDGIVTLINQKGCEILGYSAEEIIGRDWMNFLPEDIREETQEAFQQFMVGHIQQADYYENRVLTKSGEERLIAWHNTWLRDDEGAIIGSLSSGEDITARKSAETALMESNTRFRTLFEASPDAIVLIDPNNRWSIIDCNTAACQMNGYSREELLGQSIDILNAKPPKPDEQTEYLRKIQEQEILHYETSHRRKDGTIFEVEVSTSLIHVGNRQLVLGIDRDITERKKSEVALIESNTRFQTLFEASPDAIMLIDPQGDWPIIDCNMAACQLNGYSREELIGQPVDTLNLRHSELDGRGEYLESIRQAGVLHFEEFHKRKDGTVIAVDVSTSLIQFGTHDLILGIDRDITQRKRAEEELRRRAGETSALLETSLALTNLDLEATLQTIGNSANTLFLADGCRIFLTEPDGDTLGCVLALGENTDAFLGLQVKIGEGVTGAVAAKGMPEIVNEMQNDPRAVQVPGTDEEQEAIMFAPLKERDRTIGILSVRRLGEGRPFEQKDLELLEAFASMAASAVSNARLFEETRSHLAELRASEERFRQLADNIQEGFWMTDAENDKELYMSPAVETIWGQKIATLMNESRAFIDSVFPEDRPAVLEAIEKEKSGERAEVEYRILQPDGSLRWIWDRAFPIFDESGKVRRIAGISADITERKQAEQELRKLSRAVEQSSSTIVITDTSGTIEYVNPKFTEITGYSFEEVVGRNPRFLKSGLTAEDEYVRLWQTITDGGEWHGELLNKKKDGTLYWESVTISPVMDDRKRITHFVGVKEDITERKQSEIETRRHIAELEAVYENGLAVGRLLEPGEIGNRVIETFSRYLPWHHVTIRLKKEESDDLELVAFSLPHLKEEERAEAQRHFVARINKVGQGLSGWAIQTGTPLRTGNVHVHPEYIGTHTGIQSGLYMPLKVGERVIGVISVESEAPNAFNEQDERLLATLANQTAVAFENARLYEAMQKELLERKRAEDALRVSETHYRALADSITDILFELDQDLHYTHWNKASEALTGIPARNAVGKSMEDVLGRNEEQSRIKAIYEDVLRKHQPRTFETILAFTGENRSFEVTAYPSMRGVSVVAKDVTDRKRTEMIMQKRFELMEYSARHSLNDLMQKTVDEVSELTDSTIGFFHFMEDDQTHLGMQTWSTNALQLFHVSSEDGAHLPLDRAGVWAEAVRQRRPLVQNDYESLAKKKGIPQGHVPILREMVIPIIRNERIMAVMGIGNKPQDYSAHDLELAARMADYAWDITERKQMEIALELERNQLMERVEERTSDLSRANSNLARALRVKDEFLANMSHELRTPLNAILGLSESLGEQIAGPLNEKQQKYISTIGESGHHLLSLINDILDLAKIDAGHIKLDINKVDIRSVCNASLRMVKQLAQKKNQEISLEIDDGLGLMWADERRLKQMMVNLLGNAVKFTPEDGKLGLEVHGDEEANQIAITVWDNGIGIKEDDLARLFQPFVQLDSGLAREATGTGLGLALVTQMARLHGGSVNVTSEAGKGSRFSILLPWQPALAMDSASRLKITGKFRAIQFDDTNKPTILLVEDTQEVVMMLKDYLELAGYKVFTAQDGVDGIVQARHIKPDLILMDVQMPRMNGFETTRKLRSDPNFRYTPIIALTALAMPHDRERCLEAGMDEYISKPVNLKALVKIIQSCLFKQESRAR